MSAASKGAEREGFLREFLRACHPPVYRFGTGDITDSAGHRSGQADVVVEYPFAPSLTLSEDARLYLAESVAAVIEVKSDVAKQWAEVEATAKSIGSVTRSYSGGMVAFGKLNADVIKGSIPVIAVGYTGWAKLETLREHVSTGTVDGILVIDQSLFVSSPRLGDIEATEAWSLWAMLCALHAATEAIGATRVDLSLYAR